jgi:hypothetical protein
LDTSLEQVALQLGFTVQELAFNRAGQLSTRQFWDSVRAASLGAGFVLAVLAAIAVVVFVVRPSGLWPKGLLVLISLLLGAGLLLALYVGGQWVLAAVERKVLVAEGSVSFAGSGRGPPAMVIGQARVPAPAGARSVLTKGGSYRVFYLAHSQAFLSVEPLTDQATTTQGTAQ